VTKARLPDGVPSDNSSRLNKSIAASLDAGGEMPRLQPASRKKSGGPNVIFAATNTATPNFTGLQTESAPAASLDSSADFPEDNASRARFSRVIVEVEEDEDDDDDDDKKKSTGELLHGPHLPAPMLILIAIGLLLAALGAYVTSQNQDPQPYCSQQPDWNQFNCKAD